MGVVLVSDRLIWSGSFSVCPFEVAVFVFSSPDFLALHGTLMLPLLPFVCDFLCVDRITIVRGCF